jgi:hypothetical protein
MNKGINVRAKQQWYAYECLPGIRIGDRVSKVLSPTLLAPDAEGQEPLED